MDVLVSMDRINLDFAEFVKFVSRQTVPDINHLIVGDLRRSTMSVSCRTREVLNAKVLGRFVDDFPDKRVTGSCDNQILT